MMNELTNQFVFGANVYDSQDIQVNIIESNEERKMTMREISKWAVARALGGVVPNKRYSYTKDNTLIKSTNREHYRFEKGVIPWCPYSTSPSSLMPYRSISINEVWLFENKILWYKAIDGRLCYLHPIVHWTMAGYDTVTTRERLNAFGIQLIRKRGKTFWKKPNGEIVEVDPSAEYSIHGRYVLDFAVRNNILSRQYLDYVCVVRNKRRCLR